MIDTVVLRFHDLEKNEKIISRFKSNERTGSTEVEMEKSAVSDLEGNRIRMLLYHDSDRAIPLVRHSTMRLRSSHYSVAYKIDERRDFVEFNFSIPKYIYGTNFFQFIDYTDQSARMSWANFFSFIQDFVKIHLGKIDYYDLEVNRIDYCYNQFFNSKDDALRYLDLQKELNKKFSRRTENSINNYNTSLMYHTKRHSFKIYHKGTEFEKNDKKELIKTGNKFGYDVPSLQIHADRTLRYEATYRNSMFNYVFQQDFLSGKKHHDVADLIKKARRMIGSRKAFDKQLGKSFQFRMETDWRNLSFDSFLSYLDLQVYPFDFQLFESLYVRFWNDVKAYQCKVQVSPLEILKRVEENNGINDAKNNYRRKRNPGASGNKVLLIAMLSQHMDIRRLKDYIDERTFYRYQAELKKIGLETFNKNRTIPQPSLDYQEYKYHFGKYHNDFGHRRYIFRTGL